MAQHHFAGISGDRLVFKKVKFNQASVLNMMHRIIMNAAIYGTSLTFCRRQLPKFCNFASSLLL